MFMLMRATLIAAALATFTFTSFAQAQPDVITPFRKAGDWEIEYVPETRSTIRHCRAKRGYRTEEWLVVLRGPNYTAIDFSGDGTAALGQNVEVTYTFTPGTKNEAKARLVPDKTGFEYLRLAEFVSEVGHEDELDNSKRLEIRTKRPPANPDIKGRWSYDLKGANRAMKILSECWDKLGGMVDTPPQNAPQQTAKTDNFVPPASAQTQDPRLPYNFCTQFADRTMSNFYRMRQAKCGNYQKLNMDWDTHYRWCESQGPRVSLANLVQKDEALKRCN